MKFSLLFFIYNLVIKIYVFFLSLLKVKKNRILLHQRLQYGYDCNLKYIAEELKRRNCNCEIIWITSREKALNQNFPNYIKVVLTCNKFESMFYFATSKFCITNIDFNSKKYRLKKNNQIYINTWHGSLGIKKIEFDKNSAYRNYDFKKYDIFVSNSSFETNIYRTTFNFKRQILELGHPRNDIFFEKSSFYPSLEKIKEDIENFANIKIGNKKLVLYAPTFREDFRQDCFNMDYNLLLEVLNKKYKEDFILVLRFHPHIKINLKKFLKNNIVDLTKYPDIQGLMVYSDIMISDYSSCIFDYMLSRKPAFIYASDIEKYNNERGFFYPLESTPFPIITNNNELSEKILSFDYNEYRANVEKFLEEKGCIEDGFSSERVVDLIENYMESEG